MFIVLLKFSANKAAAGGHMEAHNAWVKSGFDDGVFLLVGSLEPGQGGAIVAQAASRDELEMRVSQDPFVAANVVAAEILEISPAQAEQRLQFLLG